MAWIKRIMLALRGLKTLVGKEVYIEWRRNKGDWTDYKVLYVDSKWICLRAITSDGKTIEMGEFLWHLLSDIEYISVVLIHTNNAVIAKSLDVPKASPSLSTPTMQGPKG